MKKKYSDCYTFDLGMFPFTILVSIGQTDKEFLDSLNEMYNPDKLKQFTKVKSLFTLDKNECTKGMCGMTKGNTTYIRIKDGNLLTPSAISTVAHESLHAASFILRTAGVKFCDKSEEAFTYATDYILKEIYLKYTAK